MKILNRRNAVVAALTLLLVALVAGLPLLRRILWAKELNPVLRGRLAAREVGCLNCHRPWGATEIPNPGSRWGTVPSFGGGNAMMYTEKRREVEEMIRYGVPRAWLAKPAVRRRLESQRIRMPAFGERLSERQIADLTAWASAVERIGRVGGEAAAAGRAVALTNGCPACHGIEGSGGHPNPGSLGGFIPGFAGGNFPDLVRDEAEFREWVRTGKSHRLEANPVVRYFWKRQAISMPAYGDALSEEDLSSLWTWIQALRGDRGGDGDGKPAAAAGGS